MLLIKGRACNLPTGLVGDQLLYGSEQVSAIMERKSLGSRLSIARQSKCCYKSMRYENKLALLLGVLLGPIALSGWFLRQEYESFPRKRAFSSI